MYNNVYTYNSYNIYKSKWGEEFSKSKGFTAFEIISREFRCRLILYNHGPQIVISHAPKTFAVVNYVQ